MNAGLEASLSVIYIESEKILILNTNFCSVWIAVTIHLDPLILPLWYVPIQLISCLFYL